MPSRREILKQTCVLALGVTGAAHIGGNVQAAAALERQSTRGARIRSVARRDETILRLGGSDLSCVFRERVSARPGETLRVAIDAAHVHLFDAESGRRLTD